MLNQLKRRSLFYVANRFYTSKVKFIGYYLAQNSDVLAIQPTGEVHLGNYLGAVKKWIELQNSGQNTIISIADLHSMSLPQDPVTLRENILLMTATLLASGIDTNKTIFFKQSDIPQHSELYWIFGTLSTMARLSRLSQFQEKTANMKEIPLGIYMYPVLQAADIALYKTNKLSQVIVRTLFNRFGSWFRKCEVYKEGNGATHVPVGQDQIQHIELTNHLIKAFNRKFGLTFPVTQALIENRAGSIKSLINPVKKMSKSSLPKSRINLRDSPEEILQKCKKALTDCNSRVSYDPEGRPGVSNLILIHSYLMNKSIESICKESENINTGEYKVKLAQVITEKLKPMREEINRYLSSPDHLEKILQSGAEKAYEIADRTMREVKVRIGVATEQKFLLKMESEVK